MRPTRLMILGDATSPHTLKWVKALAQHPFDIHIFSLVATPSSLYQTLSNVHVVDCQFNQNRKTSLKKIRYLTALPKLLNRLKQVKPDLLHAFHGGVYGLLAKLTGFHPRIVSLWGSEVYRFAKCSFLHRKLLSFNLQGANALLSTSHCMAKEAQQYTKLPIEVIPFGVDVTTFSSLSSKPPSKDTLNTGSQSIFIGTVKELKLNSGIHHLLHAFALVQKKLPQLSLKLCVIGEGPELNPLRALARQLGIHTQVHFAGRLPHEQMVCQLRQMTVAVFLSQIESFGVAAIEAGMLGIPVVASDADGFCETIIDGVTGIIVPKANPGAAADAIETLLTNSTLAERLGKQAQEHTKKHYDLHQNTQQLLRVYHRLLNTPHTVWHT